MGFIKRAWKGEEQLWKVFWLYGILGSIFLQIAVGAIAGKGLVGFAIQLPYAVWLMVSEWRCAWNAGTKFWGFIVRIIVVFAVISYLMAAIMMGGLATLIGGKGIKAMGDDMQQCAQMLVEKAKAAGVDQDEYNRQHPEDMRACVKNFLGKTKPPSSMLPQSSAVPSSAPSAVVPNAPISAESVPPTQPAPAATPIAPASVAATVMDTCEQKMADYAVANKADPKAYIAQNQAYLAQCRQASAGQGAGKP